MLGHLHEVVENLARHRIISDLATGISSEDPRVPVGGKLQNLRAIGQTAVIRTRLKKPHLRHRLGVPAAQCLDTAITKCVDRFFRDPELSGQVGHLTVVENPVLDDFALTVG